MNKNIVIVGLGQLGSRHLQSVASVKETCEVYIVDPSMTNVNRAVIRFKQMPGWDKHSLHTLTSIEDLSLSFIDVLIISTNSNVRKSIVKHFLLSTKLRYVILEKFLFQSHVEYDEISLILFDKKNVRVFVNCPRRLNEQYQKIAEYLRESKETFHMEVDGSNWGLGCNGIHFIDLFSFFTGQTNIKWISRLDNEILQSKRDGYIEFTGKMYGIDCKGNMISLASSFDNSKAISIKVSNSRFTLTIDEDLHVSKRINGELEETYPINLRLQSELTSQVIEQLFRESSCNLTPYSESAALHKNYLTALLTHYQDVKNVNIEKCPIT